MKRTNRILSILCGAAIIFGMASCNEDPTVDEQQGLPVADGFYFTKAGEDPEAAAQLKAATVDAPAFSAMTREGFVQGYAYLTAGNYNLVEVVDKAVATTYGGTITTVTGELDYNKECDESGYGLVIATVDGAAFNIPTDGLYVVAYDAITSEIIFDEITSMGIIGGATPEGWGADTDMNTSASITADGASWTLEGVTIDVGEMKFRYNCRWAIDRRIDHNADFSNENGYSMFTNYGGTIAQLLPGNEGPNIQVAEYAVYTVTFNWDPLDGVSATLTKTGEAEPKPEYPAELYMIGGSIGGWDWALNGIQMIPVHSNPHLFWRIVWIDPALADPGVKFAPQAEWMGDFGKTGDATDGVFAKGSDNVPPPAIAGYYMVVVNLEEGAETIEVNAPLVYGIGGAFSDDTFTAASAINLFTVDNVNEVITSPTFAHDAELRMHVAASTLKAVTDDPAVEWWQAEFIVLSGVIEYRGTGGDQARANVTTGQHVSLNFKEGTGTIE
jgi:hypothetical protein